jgi:hypothetical protein
MVRVVICRYNAPISGTFAGEYFDKSTTVPTLFHSHGGKAYVTNLTVQGDGLSPCGAVVVYTAAQLLFVGVPRPSSHLFILCTHQR